jgi:uncharacterized SAM-binding protein YcdF (DUF218 family)
MPPFLIGTILPTEPERKPRLGALLIFFVLIAGILGFLNVGKWLVREDPLQKAAAMAVLSGRMPQRALEAARLYKQGYAPVVWLTHTTEPGVTLEKLSIAYAGEEVYDKLLLIHEGVPEDAIQILDPPIMNTADEIRTIGGALAKQTNRKVILVTSKVHTRRTKTLWGKLSRKDGEAIVRGVSDDDFDAAHWWRTTSDARDVVREVLGLLNAWAGLPLRPAGA